MKKLKKTKNYLIVASTEAYSGKSATILGLGEQLKQQGLAIGYAKPIGIEKTADQEADLNLIAEQLTLPTEAISPPVIFLSRENVADVVAKKDTTNYPEQMQSILEQNSGELVMIEGPGNLWEGGVFHLSVPQMANFIEASVLLVAAYRRLGLVDILLKAKQDLGESLLGVIINDIPIAEMERVSEVIEPFLAEQGIEILGLIPRSELLRSISVREIKKQLAAEVLCRSDRLDLMVESLAIGAMNVNSAMEYFRKWKNMAIVTGADRADVQLAALESSTHCLILTGQGAPQPFVLSRAEDLEIPILSVNLDTLTTVEIIDSIFGRVRVSEPIKVQCIQELMNQHFAIDRLLDKL
ncbi:MAG: phosphotransacetylase family protein [Gloeocapsa sp. DLM2.Bin57]|nr:MAG: phosphotransacetylase family protein [Gloeocapsa sp. DLM2.Bin57]